MADITLSGPADAASSARPAEEWTGITIAHRMSFADLYLWLGAWLPGFCRVAAQDGTELAATRFKAWFPYGAFRDGSVAVLAVRPTPDESGVEFGSRAWGPRSARPRARWPPRLRPGIRPPLAADGLRSPTGPQEVTPQGFPAAAAGFRKQHGLVSNHSRQ